VASSVYKRARRVDRISGSDLTTGLLWVVVFGPGHGEAILVRLPDERVGIVDGCREPEGDCPVTQLLAELSPPRLLFACLTHPHEDHYKGLGRLLATRPGLVDHVWHVLAMTSNECKAVLKYAKASCRPIRGKKRPKLPDAAEWRGVERVFNAIMTSATNGAHRRQLLAERALLREVVDGSNHPFEVEAWGPTDNDVTDALLKFVARRGPRIPRDDLPNQVSGALLLRWGRARVLLAGDLYAQVHHHEGWGPARGAAAREKRVQVVNVAHHASETAYDPQLWAAMNPLLAIVTPFKYAGLNNKSEPCQPPKPSDIRRLISNTCEVAITAEPRWIGASMTPAAPRRRNAGGLAKKPTTPPAGVSPLLGAYAGVDSDDGRNAIAVGLDSRGTIVDVILGGAADFYR
jgi:beta-lactamase superfamily II metal-dependent hydrolase